MPLSPSSLAAPRPSRFYSPRSYCAARFPWKHFCVCLQVHAPVRECFTLPRTVALLILSNSWADVLVSHSCLILVKIDRIWFGLDSTLPAAATACRSRSLGELEVRSRRERGTVPVWEPGLP